MYLGEAGGKPRSPAMGSSKSVCSTDRPMFFWGKFKKIVVHLWSSSISLQFFRMDINFFGILKPDDYSEEVLRFIKIYWLTVSSSANGMDRWGSVASSSINFFNASWFMVMKPKTPSVVPSSALLLPTTTTNNNPHKVDQYRMFIFG